MIARKSALIVFLNILNGLLGYVALFFISRYMSPESYGIMAFAYSFVALFNVLSNLGFDHAHIKRISEGKDLGRCIGTFFTVKIGLIGLMSTCVLGFILFWKFVMQRGFETPTHEIAIYIMLIYWIIHILANSFINTFKAKKEIVKAESPLFFEVLIRTIIIIYIAVSGYGAIALVMAYIIGDFAFLLSSFYFFRRYPKKSPSKIYFKNYSVFALPLLVVVTCDAIMTNIDKVLIQLFWSASDVGYYFAAFRLSMFINIFSKAIGTLLFPTFSELHIKNDVKGINKLRYQSERYLSMIVFPMVFGIVVLAEPAAFILLSGWMPAVPILQILPFFVLLAALERPYQSQFLGTDRPKITRNRVLIMIFFNVILNILLIPKDIQMLGINLAGMGAKGAAIATVVSYGVGLLYSRVISWRLTKTKGNPRILLHALSAVIMAGVLYYLLYGLNLITIIVRWYYLLGFALLGLGIYLGLLYLLKEFTKNDYNFLLSVLNIKKMIDYIKKETRR